MASFLLIYLPMSFFKFISIFANKCRPWIGHIKSPLISFSLTFTSLTLILFVLFTNLPEHSFLSRQMQSGLSWDGEVFEGTWHDLTSNESTTEETGDEAYNEDPSQSDTTIVSISDHDSDNEPAVLMDLPLWPGTTINGDSDSEKAQEKFPSPLLEAHPISRLQVLDDPLHRVSDEFAIPDSLKRRTQFWFNIYTLYDSKVHVIHHLRYPWIVFKVIDTQKIIAEGRGPLWLRQERAHKYVAKEKKKIIASLKKLSKMKSFSRLTKAERDLLDALKEFPGNRGPVLRFAAQNVRSQLGQKDFFVSGLSSSHRYLSYMEEVFIQQGLPIELTRLPFVESSFNVKAQSKVGASGIWQIMPRTGKAYLKITNSIDERNSPIKATLAAARILRSYHRALKKWPLTITGYNHGIGGILKAQRTIRSTDLSTIIRKYHQGSFKFASSNFYTCFLAALYAERYQDKIFPDVIKEPLVDREVVNVTRPLRLNRLVSITGLNLEAILELNLDLKHSASANPLLPKGFKLHLPPGAGHSVRTHFGQEKSRPSEEQTDNTTFG